MIFASRDSIRLLADGAAIIVGQSTLAVMALLSRSVTSLIERGDCCPCEGEPGQKYHYYGVEHPG